MIRCIERLTGLLLLVLVLLAGTSRPASACSCAESPTVAAAKDTATAVFAGTVTEASGGSGGIDSALGLGDSVTFRVERSWRGVETQSVRLSVQLGAGGGTCEYEFQQGRAYLVYALPSDTPDAPLQTNICTRTAPLAAAGEDLRLLGPATIALRPVSSGTAYGPLVVLGLGAAVVLVGAVLVVGWASRRRTRG